MPDRIRRLRTRHFVLIGLSLLLLIPTIRLQLVRVMLPLTGLVGRSLTGVAELSRFVRQLPEIYEERADLEGEVVTLRAEREARLGLEREVVALRRLLELPGSEPKPVIGEIVGGLPGSLGMRLLVETGDRTRLRPDQAVMSGGLAFGRVVELRETVGIVEPLTASKQLRAVTIGGGQVTGLLEGRGGALVVTDIDPAALIGVGDEVRIAGQDEVFAPGTLVGSLKSVETPPGGLVRRAQVMTPKSLRETRFVELLP